MPLMLALIDPVLVQYNLSRTPAISAVSNTVELTLPKDIVSVVIQSVPALYMVSWTRQVALVVPLILVKANWKVRSYLSRSQTFLSKLNTMVSAFVKVSKLKDTNLPSLTCAWACGEIAAHRKSAKKRPRMILNFIFAFVWWESPRLKKSQPTCFLAHCLGDDGQRIFFANAGQYRASCSFFLV